jgi:SAM-dependent methyltransferase
MRDALRRLVTGTPLEPLARALFGRNPKGRFASDSYWENRYRSGGNSGAGSYGRLADFKAEFLNDFVVRHDVASVIEFGCGDGNQLSLAAYPRYLGVDVSEAAVRACKARFEGDGTKSFSTLLDYKDQQADLSLSLDVIYHLVEDNIFDAYMTKLFGAAERFVIIYASNHDEQAPARHVRHRRFTDWVDEHRRDFSLDARVPNRYPFDPADPDNTSFADFHVFARRAEPLAS